jgi:transposase InsO family protein
MALGSRRPGPGLPHHTVRGSKQARQDHRAALAAVPINSSASRICNWWDDAHAESFFAAVKVEELLHHALASGHLARDNILRCLCSCNAHRRNSTLGIPSRARLEAKAHHASVFE